MSMERMFSRFRSLSGSKLNKSPTNPAPPSQIGAAPSQQQQAGPPSKEDILDTIDGFGEKIQGPECVPPENNNNTMPPVRRSSAASEGEGEAWMELGNGDAEPTITSITHSYSLEWEKLFIKPNYLKHLRNYAIKGNLRSSRFRSIAWKLFLEVLQEDSSTWINRTTKTRNKYMELKDRLIVNPRKAVDTVDLSVNNPLSQEDESPWNRFFLDNELRLTIKQDVIRTFPEIEFYHSQEVRDMMINVLFCYCREHESISYKQGMHELLAPIIFVLHCDHQAFLHASEMESLDDRIKCVMDPKYLENDAYAMFSQIMQTMEPWYVSKEVYPTKQGTEPGVSQPFSRPQDLNPSNVIVTKLTRIQDYLLKKADVELHLHLERQEIAPQIYGIRWIRLLFGREFPMQDLLVLWDAIFADGIGFDLVDYIFVAMLLYLRDHLLSSDYPSCLITLMRYPPVGDIHYFIDKSRHLRDPHQFPRPPKYTYQSAQTAEKLVPKEPRAHSEKAHARSHSGSSTTLQSFTRKIYTSSRPKSLSVSGRGQKMSKSSSEPMNLQTDISPVSPTPGSVPQHKRASSASLSQVEDSMFRSAPSSGSLAHGGHRSTVSTPGGELPDGGSPPKFASLPSSHRSKKSKKLATAAAAEPGADHELATLRGLIHDKEAMCSYCASKLDRHIESIQAEMLRQSLENEDEILVAIAGIKQVRDVLNGTLRFSQNLLDEDEIAINYNHYKMDVNTESSPETQESSPENPATAAVTNTSGINGRANIATAASASASSEKRKLFYVSSEENSENMDSPSDPLGSGALNSNINFKLPRDFEMDDMRHESGGGGGSSTRPSKSKKSVFRTYGPDECESDFVQTIDSPETPTAGEGESGDSELEESPNPLYQMSHSFYEIS